MASNATSVYAITPLVGVDLDNKSSAPAFKPNTAVLGSDGRKHVYAKAAGALSSTATITVGNSGTAAAATAGTYLVDTTGGIAVNQYFWAKQSAI